MTQPTSKSNSKFKPTWLACTPGEPAGIGPDILLKLIAHQTLPLVAYADRDLLSERAKLLNLNISLEDYEKDAQPKANTLRVKHIPLAKPAHPGILDKNNSAYVLSTLTHATQDCLNGEMAALITGPVHKGIINDAGFKFSGHTEFLANLTQSPRPVMMLANKNLRLCLLTTHLPLRQVADAITANNLSECIQIIYHDLQTKFNLKHPRITILGLNPHAGEGGHLGHEEIDILIPTITKLQQMGMHLVGPLPADTAFTEKYLSATDVVLSMYHDQGLPVIKAQGFGETVNITLGLNIIRTSVDHGTALELAGSGHANHHSLAAAVEAALAILNANQSLSSASC